MNWPLPDTRSRCCSAARIAIDAYMPVTRSATISPTFCGPPPGSSSGVPVMPISPPMPWKIES